MSQKSSYLVVKDHSVSGEEFELVYNSELDMLETTPRPESDQLPNYYKSEDYISHTDTKRNLFEKVYHLVRSFALKSKVRRIDSFGNLERRLLDIGCGTGDFLKAAKDNNWEISGIEPDTKARKIANSKTNNVVYDVDHLLHFETGSFDVITLWHVLEHLPKLNDHLSVITKLLDKNGTLVIAVPNYKSHDAKVYKSYWAAYDVPRHLWHFSQTSISKLVQPYGFEVKEIAPMYFDAFYVSLLSEKYRSGSMNPFKAFWVGIQSNLKAKRTKEYSSLIYVIKKA